MASKDRRSRHYEFDLNYDPFVGLDANEYLIENYPSMSLPFRRAVWTTIQTDDEIDWEPLWDLIDTAVEKLASTFPENESVPIPLDDDNNSSDGSTQETSDSLSSKS